MARKVIAFDVFGTVFNLTGVPKNEIRDYISHIGQKEWSPLRLPDSWATLPAHPDAAQGIEMLRKKFFVVTCSNGPLGLLAKLSKHNSISWDAIIPLELNRVFKPAPEAYMTVCETLDFQPHEVTMVTANKTFGDLEGSRRIGMEAILIRNETFPTIIDLAKSLLGEYDHDGNM